MMQHLDEDAELYPLGVLDDDAARRVERHIAGCGICAARVAGAQLVTAALAAPLPAADPSPQLERRLHASLNRPERERRRDVWGLRAPALAAALLLALASLAWQTLAVNRLNARADLALATIVHSHFKHVTMTAHGVLPPAAKVLYAQDGSWLYIIAGEPQTTLRAVARSASGETELGSLEGSAHTVTLLVHPRERVDSLELRRDGRTVATATLTY